MHHQVVMNSVLDCGWLQLYLIFCVSRTSQRDMAQIRSTCGDDNGRHSAGIAVGKGEGKDQLAARGDRSDCGCRLERELKLGGIE